MFRNTEVSSLNTIWCLTFFKLRSSWYQTDEYLCFFCVQSVEWSSWILFWANAALMTCLLRSPGAQSRIHLISLFLFWITLCGTMEKVDAYYFSRSRQRWDRISKYSWYWLFREDDGSSIKPIAVFQWPSVRSTIGCGKDNVPLVQCEDMNVNGWERIFHIDICSGGHMTWDGEITTKTHNHTNGCQKW